MWWERWIPESYLTKSSVCGVECVYDADGVSFNYCILNSKKNKVEISYTGKTKEVSEIIKLAKKNSAPISLVISGKGIIVKKILFSENDSLILEDLIKQHFPTIQSNEFYVQFYKNPNHTGHLSICRKEQVNESINLFKEAECVNVFIGSLVCNSLAGFTASYNRLSTYTNQLELVSGFVESAQPLNINDSITLHIDELQIEAYQLLAFAAGFSYLTGQTNFESNNTEILQLSTQHKEKLKLKVVVVTCIVCLFLMSTINSFFFFQKFEENNALEVELNLYESKNTQITKLLDSYQKKKSLIEQAGIFNNRKLSVYADKIAASIPSEIVLRELYFNPEISETENDTLVDFKNNELIIKGNCNKSLLLNEWLNVLKSQSFVKSVNLENFIFNAEAHLPNFVLKLETK